MQYRELSADDREALARGYAEQRRQEQERQAKAQEHNSALSIAIAAALDAHRREPDDENAGRYECIELAAPEGAALYLHYAAGRVEVTGEWPADPDDDRAIHPRHRRRLWPRDIGARRYDERPYPKITVSTDKPAATIARDIARRFLPEYLDLYAQLCAYADKRTQARARTVAAADTLLAAEPGASRPSYSSGAQADRHVRGPYHQSSYWEAETGSEDVYSLTFKHLSTELAAALIRLYAQQIES